MALGDLQPYIDDALDLIEFANGGTDTPWGKLRAEMGHPEPIKTTGNRLTATVPAKTFAVYTLPLKK